MVKIRLSQTGAKNKRMYRIVVIEEGKRRDGRAIETLGHYNPLVTPPHLDVNRERIKYWLSVGAMPSDGAAKILGLK